MRFKWKEFISLTAAIISVAVGIAVVGIFVSQAVWKIDAAILGGFLLGDYPLRWILGLRSNKTFNDIIHLVHRHSYPPWARLAIASCWFIVIVFIVGEAAMFVGIISGLFASASGSLTPSLIGEWSLILTLALSLDFLSHYRKELGAMDDFWENMIP